MQIPRDNPQAGSQLGVTSSSIGTSHMSVNYKLSFAAERHAVNATLTHRKHGALLSLCLFTLFAAFCVVSNATAGSALDAYWPLNDGDSTNYAYGTNTLGISVSYYGVNQYMISSTSVDGSGYEIHQTGSEKIQVISGKSGWITISFSPAINLLNESVVANGGTITTQTTVTQRYAGTYPATFTVTVGMAGTVTVPAGTFTNCRSVTVGEVATIPNQGTVSATYMSAILAPGVGIIKKLVSPDTGAWAELVSGTVGGVDVTKIPFAPSITTTTPLTTGTVGTLYTQSLTANYGVKPYTWTITSGNLPAGLDLSSSGVINGTPTTATTANFTVQVKGSNGLSSTKVFSLTIVSAEINGVCGQANGQSLVSSPTTNFCSVGAPSLVTGSGPWNWSCSGSNGGSNAICSANLAKAIWQQTSGPEGGYIGVVAIDPNNSQTIYAGIGNGGGVYKSNNGGISWNAVMTNAYVQSLTIDRNDSQVIYAGGGTDVYKSVNGGGSWITKSSGLNYAYVQSLAIDPNNSRNVFAGTDGGMFKSTNSGDSWTVINSGLVYTNVQTLAINSSNSNVIYAGTSEGGVFKSSDGGSSWSVTNNGLTGTNVQSLVINPGNSQIIYAGTSPGGVFKSTDSGSSWSAVNSGMTNTNILALAIDPSNGQTIYAGTWSKVYKSIDGAGSWTGVDGALPMTWVYSLAIDRSNNQNIYAGTGGWLFKSTSGGDSWTVMNKGVVGTYIRSISIDVNNSQTIYAGTFGSGLAKSSDGGSSWSLAGSGLTRPDILSIVVDPSSSQTVYAALSGDAVYKSNNGGVSWSALNGELTYKYVQTLVIDRTNSQTVYAGTLGDGLYKSINGGSSWSTINSGLTNTDIQAVAIDPYSNQTIYAGTQGGLFKSTNGGGTWSAANNGLSGMAVMSLLIDPSNSRIIYAGTWTGGMFKSLNGGDSWNAINSGIVGGGFVALAIDPNSNQTIYAGSMGRGVYLTVNGGASWRTVNTGLTNLSVETLTIDPNSSQTVYAGTSSGGVFKMVPAVSISGSVIQNGTGLSSIILSGAICTVSNAAGSYTCTVTAGWSGTITPTLAGYAFNPVSRSYNNITSDQTEQDYSALLQYRNLSLTLSGTGSGSVNSTPTGPIACTWPPQEGACSTTKPVTTSLTLTAIPGNNSSFSGWGGACTNATGDCTVAMTADKSVTATFTAAPKAKIGSTGYATLFDAFTAVANDTEILLLGADFPESLIMDKGFTILLKGGYNADFSGQSGNPTTIQSPLTVKAGALKVNGIRVK